MTISYTYSDFSVLIPSLINSISYQLPLVTAIPFPWSFVVVVVLWPNLTSAISVAIGLELSIGAWLSVNRHTNEGSAYPLPIANSSAVKGGAPWTSSSSDYWWPHSCPDPVQAFIAVREFMIAVAVPCPGEITFPSLFTFLLSFFPPFLLQCSLSLWRSHINILLRVWPRQSAVLIMFYRHESLLHYCSLVSDRGIMFISIKVKI